MPKRLKIEARKLPDGMPFTAIGQEARTLQMLHQKGASGAVVYDFPGGLGYRLAAYTHSLIKKHGMEIETRHERHEGGWHGRFVLHTPVEILKVIDPAKPTTEEAAP